MLDLWMCLSTGLQEEVLHDVMVVGTATVREVAGRKHNDGIQTFSIIACREPEYLALITCDTKTLFIQKK